MATEFSMTRRVQFAETDLAGVLHFANYFRYMEEVEHAFWRSVGSCVLTREGDVEISWPRVSVGCDYASPLHFEDEIELTLRVTKTSKKSVSYEIDFRSGAGRAALGKVTAVCCSWGDGEFRSIEIPDSLRAKLQPATTSTC